MQVGLIQIDALLPDGMIVPVRASNCNDPRACHLDGAQWDPAVLRLPTLRYDFFGGAFQNALAVPRADFAVAVESLARVPAALFAQLRFGSARVRIWTGELGEPFGQYRLRFTGEIKAEPTIEEGEAIFSAGASDAWMDVPLLAAYAGTDGLEGPEDLTGTVKPLVLGDCRFVPGVLIDPVDNVYQVSAYGPVQAISAAFDRLTGLGSSAGDHADLAALLAASIPNGGWATCLAHGLVRLGAPADGKVSFHVQGDAAGAQGYVTRAGGMIARLIELAGGSYSAAVITALDSDRPWDQARVLRDQVTARQAIQELADSVAAVAGITWTGEFFVRALGFGSPEVTLNSAGTSLPLVEQVSQQAVDPPFWRLATQAALTWQVHDLGEIASDYAPRGLYSAARVYRLDDLVSASDGRSFVYINATPGAGNAPPAAPATSNTWWSLFNGATAGAPSGTTVAGRDADDVADTVAIGGGVASTSNVAGRDASDIASTVAAGGGVDTDQVSTESMVAEAVTTRTYAFTAGSLLITSGSFTWTEIQSAMITTTGQDVEIDAGTEINVIDNCKYQYRVLRDGTPLIDIGPITVSTNDSPYAPLKYVDDPVAGTYEYTFEVACNDASNIEALNRGLYAKEIKR